MNKYLIPAVVAVAVVGVTAMALRLANTNDEAPAATVSPTSVATDVQADSPLVAAVLADYDAAAVSTYGEQGSPVLLFTSETCTGCDLAISDIIKKAYMVPAGMKVFVVGMGSQPAVAERYGVTDPHTWVRVDAQGNALKKWQGGGVDELIAQSFQ